MLPLTKQAFEHPRVQANRPLASTIERLADWDRFRAMTHEELAFAMGMLLGALMTAYEALDALDDQ